MAWYPALLFYKGRYNLSSDEGKHFKSALNNFIFDVSSRGGIRHLFDLGYSAEEIARKLDYPVPVRTVCEEIYNYLTEKGIICENEPSADWQEAEYILDKDEYGRSTYRRVVKDSRKTAASDYVIIPFGLYKIKSPSAYASFLEGLDAKDRGFVESVPWPAKEVLYLKDERILRILRVFMGQIA